ncbi:MAG: FtsK/SpoIIIE domain-containing protein [Limisphaerales bacterium]
MSRTSGIRETLQLVATLRDVVRDLAGRAARLEEGFQAQAGDAARRAGADARAAAVRCVTAVQQAEADVCVVREQSAARLARRRERIARAQAAEHRRALAAVEAEEGRVKFALQKAMLEAGRRQKAQLAVAAAFRKDVESRLAESRADFAGHEAGAHRALAGFPALQRWLGDDERWPATEAAAGEEQLCARVRAVNEAAAADVATLRDAALPGLFRVLPLPVQVPVLAVLLASVFVLPRIGVSVVPVGVGAFVAGSLLVLAVVLAFAARRQAAPLAARLGAAFAEARQLHDACAVKAEMTHQREQQRLQQEFTAATGGLEADWSRAEDEIAAAREARPRAVEQRSKSLAGRAEQDSRRRLATLEAAASARIAGLRAEAEAAARLAASGGESAAALLRAEHAARGDALAAEWRVAVSPAYEAAAAAEADARRLAPPWDDPAWAGWTPPPRFAESVRLGALDVDVAELAGGRPANARFALPGGGRLSLPLFLTGPREGALVLETEQAGGADAVAALNALAFRLLAAAPAGRVTFTFFDPVGLGESFASLMHLADHETGHINGRIWTQAPQFEERLAELGAHIEKVIQMYLRNEYATIADYNAAAGVVAEKQQVLVVANFPAGFTDVAARRLLNLAASGPRCGVHLLLHWDRRQPLPHGISGDELRQHALVATHNGRGFELAGQPVPGTALRPDAPPAPEFATELLHRIGRLSRHAGRVEVPFRVIAPAPGGEWTESTADEVRVPVGRTGATKLQAFALGRGTRQHALVAGKTGSGKSTLFHVLVTNLALRCSPDEVEFYLVDFKKGVEFRAYAAHRLPHARVVAIESDRAFGLSVLERLDEELRRRGELFRGAGVQDMPGWRRAAPDRPLPRVLLVIDEFQEFFTEEDRVAQQAAVLLDRLVRQGRAFGLHVVLGSQTLGGAYSLARATLGQMAVRIALQCNEADASLIFDENNLAPRLLSRPGEGIYNDQSGAAEGNSPFQVVWLGEDERDGRLAEIRSLAEARGFGARVPVVFEGNAPSDVRDNAPLAALLAAPLPQPPGVARVWLGAPNSIKGPTEVAFPRQSGAHLLVVGQRDDAVLAMFGAALVALAAQHPAEAARFVVLDASAPDTLARAELDRLLAAVPRAVTRVNQAELPAALARLAAELEARADGVPAAPVLVFIAGLQNFRKLRQDDDFGFGAAGEEPNPAARLLELLRDGPARGLHVVAACDTWANVNRFLGRKGLGEFSARVLFQMSAADSAALTDLPDASQLGLHKALLFHDREGSVETFRPYGRLDGGWLERARAALAR